MKSWAWGAMIMAVFALGACKKSTSTTTSSTTGSGGDTGSGGSSSSSNSGGSTGSNTTVTVGSGGSSSSTNSGGSTGTGGNPGSCDNTGVCQDQDMDSTNDCAACAFDGPCIDPLTTCSNDVDCCTPQADGSCGTDSFVGCLNNCAQGDDACVMKCQTDHPTGAQEYSALIVCVICDNCLNDCADFAGNCP